MKAVVAAFNQEKALVGAFSVIIQPVVEPMDRFTALPGSQRQADRHAARAEEGRCSSPSFSSRKGRITHFVIFYIFRCYNKLKQIYLKSLK